MNSTIKLYEEDVYRRDFCATVLACEPFGDAFRVALDATAFFPEGGGQPADKGALGEARVTDVKEKDGIIWHTVTVPLRKGACVQGDIDFTRRLDHMQQHSGEHIVSGIVHAQYGYNNVGFHIGDDTVTVDFSGVLTADDIENVEKSSNWIIWKNVPVNVTYPSPTELSHLEYRSKKEIDGQVRIVSIGKTDVCACCGTHVSRSSEVGIIKLISAQSYKGGTRVTMVCGMRALADYERKCKNVDAISVQLSAKPDETAAAVKRLADENIALHAQLAAAENKIFEKTADEFAGKSRAVCFEDNLSPDSQRRMCLALCEKCDGICAVFSKKDDGYQYAIGIKSGDVRDTVKALNAAHNGKGGGKPALCQGSVAKASREDVEKFFEKI